MTTYLGKSCSFCLPRVPFVNCRQFMYLVISLLVLRAGYGIWLYQFLIIAYLFTFYLFGPHFDLYQSLFESTACLKFAKLQYVSSGFRCQVIAGSLRCFISRNYVVWPTFLLMNVFIALKGSHFWFLSDFSDQFKISIVRYKRIGYNINIMRQSACLVFNPITVNNFAPLFNCTPVGRASDSVIAPT